MYQARKILLSGAALSADQDGCRNRSHSLGEFEEFLRRWIFRNPGQSLAVHRYISGRPRFPGAAFRTGIPRTLYKSLFEGQAAAPRDSASPPDPSTKPIVVD